MKLVGSSVGRLAGSSGREDGCLALGLGSTDGSLIQAAGDSLGVPLADHLILGRDRYHSFRAAEGWDHAGAALR